MKGVLAALAVFAGMVLLAHAENQRQLRLAGYFAQLKVWQIREEAAMRDYIGGGGSEWVPSPAPVWQG